MIIKHRITVLSSLYYFFLHRLPQLAEHTLNTRTSAGQAAMQSSREPGHPPDPPDPFPFLVYIGSSVDSSEELSEHVEGGVSHVAS